MIEITNLSKKFRVYHSQKARLKTAFGYGQEKREYDTITSLKGIDLTVPKGVVHGLVGMNGAGKSTLLKILTGVLDPTTGQAVISGRVASLLELGTGFHPEMTGRDNIKTNAGLMGFSAAEIATKIDQIWRFSELGEFFDRPVKIYSSGMYVRLAFAFAIAVEPDVLIIDEALSVGDAYFQQKCLDEIYRFKKNGTTILFVSHDLGAVKLLCDVVSLLSDGEIIFTGEPLDALERYNALLSQKQRPKEAVSELAAGGAGQGIRSGSGEIEITEVVASGAQCGAGEIFVEGEAIAIEVRTQVMAQMLANPTCGILIRDRLGYDVFGTNSCHLGTTLGTFQKGDRPVFKFSMNLNLGPGEYSLTVALHQSSTHIDQNYDWRDRAIVFTVMPSGQFTSVGVAKLFPTLTIH